MFRFVKHGKFIRNLSYSNCTVKVKRRRNVFTSVQRCISAQSSKSDVLFPERVDFPDRHIGPRDQDIVTMLDSLGYKVSPVIEQPIRFASTSIKMRGVAGLRTPLKYGDFLPYTIRVSVMFSWYRQTSAIKLCE